MEEAVDIITGNVIRNPDIEAQIVYQNRQRAYLIGMLVGIILLGYALVV